MPIFHIKHITLYRYEAPVRDSANQITLFPLKDEFQKVIRHELQVSQSPQLEIFTDYYGNEVGTFTQHEPHTELRISSKMLVETAHRRLPLDDIFVSEQWRMLDELRADPMYLDYLKQPMFAGADMLLDAAMELNEKGDSPFKIAVKFCNYVYDQFEYIKGVTTVDTTLSEIIRLRAGVCQDFAHVLTSMLRFTNIPARYVSGYICPNKNGMRGEGATHAWAEAYIPGYGWLGLDPTNNCIANEKHIRLAVGRNFSDCSPVKGVYSGPSGHILDVTVSVGYDDDEMVEAELHAPAREAAYSRTQPSDNVSKNSYQRYLDDIKMQQQQQQQ